MHSKNTITLLTAIMTAALLTGCNSQDHPIPETTETVVESMDQSEVETETSEAETTAPESECTVENTEFKEVAEDIPAGLYHEFLNNRAEVTFDLLDVYGTDSFFDSKTLQGNSYTLEKLTQILIANYQDSGNMELHIQYASIDCGKDGIPELALRIDTPTVDDWSQFFVLKEYDGQLKAVYTCNTWARSYLEVNVYGYISHYGSGGAATSYYQKDFVDADGKYHFLYKNVVDGWSGLEEHLDDSITQPTNNFVYLGFSFTNEEITTHYYPVNTYAFYKEPYDQVSPSYYCYQALQYDDSIYQPGFCIKDFLDSEGVKVYSLSDVDQMIAETENKEGLTKEVRDGEQVKWQQIVPPFRTILP